MIGAVALEALPPDRGFTSFPSAVKTRTPKVLKLGYAISIFLRFVMENWISIGAIDTDTEFHSVFGGFQWV